MKRWMVAALLLVALSAQAGERGKGAWKEVQDDDGITVWTRDVQGSSVREVKAQGAIDAPIDRIWDVLVSVEKYTEFMPYVLEAKVLERPSASESVEYQRIDPPFVDMRDYVLRVQLDKNTTTGVYKRTWSPVEGKGPQPCSDCVRLTVVDGSWTLERVGEQQTLVTYYLYTDPGGSIPAWVANKANSTSVPDLLTAVKKRSLNPSYKR